MKKLLAFTAAFLLTAGVAHAERYVMVTHTQGTDPFWPVVEKGAKDAAKALGVELEYNFAPSGDMADMAKLIESATATKPDGLIVSLPDAAALGGAIKALCLNQEAFNTALVSRCEGYFKSMGQKLNMIDVSNDVAQIKTRTAAALQANPDVNALLATGPHVCEAAAEAVAEVGAKVHLSCFDMTPGVIKLIKDGKVAFTIDQQQRLQGYLPVVVLHLYNTNAGMLPGANIPSGPGFVDAKNAAAVEEQAGVNR